MSPTGRCYEDAFWFVLHNSHSFEENQVKLVHGRVIKPDGKTIDHAWMKLGKSRIWEPQSDTYLDRNQFEKDGVVDAEYSLKQALRLWGGTMNYGPWTARERRKYKADD